MLPPISNISRCIPILKDFPPSSPEREEENKIEFRKKNDKNMSLVTKSMLGLSAVAVATTAAIAIKKKATAAKLIKKAADEAGIDVNLYKFLNKEKIEIKNIQDATYSNCVEFLMNNAKGNKGNYKYTILSPEKTKELFDESTKQNSIIPNNSFLRTLEKDDGTTIKKELVIPETINDSLLDLVRKPWEDNGILTQSFRIS